MSNFDVDTLTKFAIISIEEFAQNHPNETFYGFAIDGNLLCLNSEEKFQQTLESYQLKWDGYTTQEQILNLKNNTGDWEYQGFSEFKNGFDMDSYLEHYHSDDEDQETSEYTIAINSIIKNLKKSNAFDKLKKTPDFYVLKVEHNY